MIELPDPPLGSEIETLLRIEQGLSEHIAVIEVEERQFVFTDQIADFNHLVTRGTPHVANIKDFVIQESDLDNDGETRRSTFLRKARTYLAAVQRVRIRSERQLEQSNTAETPNTSGGRDYQGRVTASSEQAATANPTNFREVWVIQGLDLETNAKVDRFLQNLDLRPIDFRTAVRRAGTGVTWTLDVVVDEIANAPAVFCLLTDDEFCKLREGLGSEPAEGYLPRPNVTLEAGMALACAKDRMVIVRKPKVRNFSDMAGIHYATWSNNPTDRHDIVGRLQRIMDRYGVKLLTENGKYLVD